jgi:hypothetical protein
MFTEVAQIFELPFSKVKYVMNYEHTKMGWVTYLHFWDEFSQTRLVTLLGAKTLCS